MSDSPIEIVSGEANAPVAASVIWLHGLGASGDDFVPVVPELKMPQSPAVRFVFPHAPVQPITINGGMPMRGWFDITSLDFEQREQDLSGMRDSVASINQLIEQEIERGISADKLVLAGFSQGGAIALMTALEGPHKIAGVMALSTYLPDAENVLETFKQRSIDAASLPVFMAHGQYDDVIQMRFAEASRDALVAQGFDVQWQAYPIPHSVSAEEIQDISQWLKGVLLR